MFRYPSPSSPLIMIDFGLAKYFEDGETSTRTCGSIYFLVLLNNSPGSLFT